MTTNNNNNVTANNNVTNTTATTTRHAADMIAALREIGKAPAVVQLKYINGRAAAPECAAVAARLRAAGIDKLAFKDLFFADNKNALVVLRAGGRDCAPEKPSLSTLGQAVTDIHARLEADQVETSANDIATSAANSAAADLKKDLDRWEKMCKAYQDRHAKMVQILTDRGIDAATAADLADRCKLVRGEKRKNDAGKEFVCFSVADIWASFEFTAREVLARFDATATATAPVVDTTATTATAPVVDTATATAPVVDTTATAPVVDTTATAPVLNAGCRSLFGSALEQMKNAK